MIYHQDDMPSHSPPPDDDDHGPEMLSAAFLVSLAMVLIVTVLAWLL